MSEPDDVPDTFARVRCIRCQCELDEDEAQAQRWGYWFVVGDLYPYCPECAEHDFGRPARAAD